MRLLPLAFPCLALLPSLLRGEVTAGTYDLAEVRDEGTLETRVVEDWQPWGRDASVRQKLVEITVCEWWPGQKVRLPVTLLAPAVGKPCRNVVIANAGVQLRAVSPSGAMLRLLKNDGVGLAYVGMTTIQETPPLETLLAGMKEHFLKTKDARYTPGWFWGMSDMRALTAVMAEKTAFHVEKAMATGGSKRGVAAAAAGLADDRFTAIMPVVTPLLEAPSGPYVLGMMPAEIQKANEQFLADTRAGRLAGLPATAAEALEAREGSKAAERISLEQARAAGWAAEEMAQANARAWQVCRVLDQLPALRARGLEMLFNEGANDNVSPGLREVAVRFPELPVCIIPGGQHGGPKTTGLAKSVASLPEVEENLFAFAEHHFFQRRAMIPRPKVEWHWDEATRVLKVTARMVSEPQPETNELWWSIDRHPDLTLAMEYDRWESAPMRAAGPGVYEASVTLGGAPRNFDFLTLHRQTEHGSTLTISSPLLHWATQ